MHGPGRPDDVVRDFRKLFYYYYLASREFFFFSFCLNCLAGARVGAHCNVYIIVSPHYVGYVLVNI